MYKIELQGCLPILLLSFIFLFIALKLWFVVVIIILYYLFRYVIAAINLQIKSKQKEKEINYTPHKGEVYKICPYCSINVKRSTKKCPNCGHNLD